MAAVIFERSIQMKVAIALCSLLLSLFGSPTYSGELRKFEFPSERVAPYLARPAPPRETDSPPQEPRRPLASAPDERNPPDAWRQQIEQRDLEIQELLNRLK